MTEALVLLVNLNTNQKAGAIIPTIYTHTVSHCLEIFVTNVQILETHAWIYYKVYFLEDFVDIIKPISELSTCLGLS